MNYTDFIYGSSVFASLMTFANIFLFMTYRSYLNKKLREIEKVNEAIKTSLARAEHYNKIVVELVKRYPDDFTQIALTRGRN